MWSFFSFFILEKTIASKSAASRRVFLEGSASIIPPSRNKIDNDEINNDNDLVSDDEDSSASVKSASSIIEPVPDLFSKFFCSILIKIFF